MPKKDESMQNAVEGEKKVEKTPEQVLLKANALVNKRVALTAAFGLVPIPLVDLAAITGVQLDMIWDLSKLYEVPFRKDLGKSIISSLLGGGLPVYANPWVSSLIKGIPFIGQTAGAASMCFIGGASTYAIGKVFIQHFESGGTFLNFDPVKVKEYFAKMYKEGLGVLKKTEASA